MRFDVRLGINLPARRSWLLREVIALVRKHQRSDGATGRIAPARTATDEYLWRYSSPMEDFGTRWVPHRVVQKTVRSLQVEASPRVRRGNQAATHRPTGTYWVDRSELDNLGFARARSHRTVFFTRPQHSDRVITTITAVQRLGLWFPFSDEDLKQAYVQRAREDHPDAGGSERRFIQLQEDYQRARQALDDIWWAF